MTRIHSYFVDGRETVEEVDPSTPLTLGRRPRGELWDPAEVISTAYSLCDIRLVVVEDGPDPVPNPYEERQVDELAEQQARVKAERKRLAALDRELARDGARAGGCGEGVTALVINHEPFDVDAVGVQVRPSAWTEWWTLESVDVLTFKQHPESPTIYVGQGVKGRYVPLDPDAVLYVRSAGGEQGWPVRDITSLNLEPKAV